MTTETKEISTEVLLRDLKPKLKEILPKHITPARFFMIADKAFRRNPKLLKCTAPSMATSLLAAAELGFEPGGALPFAHLVPYKNKYTGQPECQLIVDYRGLIDLAKRGGSVESIEAHVVFSKEQFHINYGHPKGITHVPVQTGDRGTPKGAYAIAYFASGEPQFDYMREDEIEKIRKRSSAADDGPWQTDPLEMWKKTVVRRLCKYLITADQGNRNQLLAKGLELENRAEAAEPADDILDTQATEVKETPVTMPQEKKAEPVAKKKSDSSQKTERTVGVIVEVRTVKTKKDDKFNIRDHNDNLFHTFNQSLAEAAKDYGSREVEVEIFWTDVGKWGKKMTEIRPVQVEREPGQEG